MRGAIHGIWLVTPGGKLHSAIIPNLATWVPSALQADFQVVLWTNINELAPVEITRLKAANIQVADPTACKDSPLYKYYDFFFAKGVKGDATAFALASDILRMAILDFTANDKYFIYIDPNDVELINLKANLNDLDLSMQHNKLGFSFPVGPVTGNTNVFDIRNDVLIALKASNPNFFKDYLNAYWANLEATYKRYAKPTTDAQAKLLATRISNDTSTLFFRLEQTDDNSIQILSQFGTYSENWQNLNSGFYLNHRRTAENGNTWLPIGKAHNAQEEVAINDIFLKSLVAEQKTGRIDNIGASTTIIGFAIFLCVLLTIALSYKFISSSK